MLLTLIKRWKFFFFTLQTCFVLKWANLTFLWGKTPIWNKLVTFFNPLMTADESAKKTHFSPIPLLWTSFQLISMAKRMAKNEFCIKQRHIFRLITEKKQLFWFFTHAHKPKFWLFNWESISIFLYRSLSSILAVFCPLYRTSSFCIELWLANFLGKEKI